MRKIAFYGKGGIGKSTVTSNLSAVLSTLGYRIMHIGCDPKADSTLNILHGIPAHPVLEMLRDRGNDLALTDVVHQGFNGILCVECGGPSPGVGCAGRGIITTFELLDSLEAFRYYQPDIVFYDVLGDVVCGGFAMPLRPGYAEEVVVVTSGEKMSLFAAKNIIKAVRSFSNNSYASLRGIILNERNVPGEKEIVEEFSRAMKTEIIGVIPREKEIQRFEEQGVTLVEGNPEHPVATCFKAIGQRLVEHESRRAGKPWIEATV